MKLRIAVMAIGLGALASAPASAAVVPAPSQMPKPSAIINTSALGIMAPGGQNLATTNVEQVRRRGRSARRGFRRGRSYRGRAWRGGRNYRGRSHRGWSGLYGGRHYSRRWRGGRRWYGGYGGNWIGPAIIAGTAALILGGSISHSQSRYQDRWERCDARFRSFRWSDGTYQPYGHRPRRVCPYLRR